MENLDKQVFDFDPDENDSKVRIAKNGLGSPIRLGEDLPELPGSKSDRVKTMRIGQYFLKIEPTRYFAGSSDGRHKRKEWTHIHPKSLQRMTGRLGKIVTKKLLSLAPTYKIARIAISPKRARSGHRPGFMFFGPYPVRSTSGGPQGLRNLPNFKHKAKFTFYIDARGLPPNQPVLRLECTHKIFDRRTQKDRVVPIKQVNISAKDITRQRIKGHGIPGQVGIMDYEFEFGGVEKSYNKFETRIWWYGEGVAVTGSIDVIAK